MNAVNPVFALNNVLLYLLENMSQMQQWHQDLVKPIAAREERARPSSMRFWPPREVPSVPNGATPPTRPRWAPSALGRPKATLSWRVTRGPAILDPDWTTRLGLTATRSPSRCHHAVVTNRRQPNRPQQSPPRQNDPMFVWARGAGPTSREHTRPLWPLLKDHHGCSTTGTRADCWRTLLASWTAAQVKTHPLPASSISVDVNRVDLLCFLK